MNIRVGYELIYQFPQPTPAILTLNIHHTRVSDLVRPDHIVVTPNVPLSSYRDSFGNWCCRIVAPAGRVWISSDTVVRDSGATDEIVPSAQQHAVQALPEETLMFLLGSRYCETDKLAEIAWKLFSSTPLGWARVQAICDYVNRHITFGYEHASATKSAWDVYVERRGVCRDFAHLAVAFCRCMNIPARYCTGYLGDIGVPPPYGPMDFLGLVRGLSRRALVHVRRAKQHPAHRSRSHRPGPRRRRRGDHDDVRAQHPRELSRLDRRSPFLASCAHGASDRPQAASGHDSRAMCPNTFFSVLPHEAVL